MTNYFETLGDDDFLTIHYLHWRQVVHIIFVHVPGQTGFLPPDRVMGVRIRRHVQITIIVRHCVTDEIHEHNEKPRENYHMITEEAENYRE